MFGRVYGFMTEIVLSCCRFLSGMAKVDVVAASCYCLLRKLGVAEYKEMFGSKVYFSLD